MKKLISCCGLNCATCDARIATINNDNALREATAKKWRVEYHAEGITAEMINCTGCQAEGVKIGHWADCGIRICANTKGYSTCGECAELESCATVAFVLKAVPDALDNLKSLH